MSRQAPPPQIRCAVYTRKSTEEGLEQEFNTLDAQRESGEAYIKSQAHEGWVYVPEFYDDGGFSGGNTDRPALKRLLTDIEAGMIDCVVVYKVDRLSRSLLDFAKMLEVFERHQVAEVLFLDADNVPVRDPTFLFETPEYQAQGAAFWPDFGRLAADRLAWRVFGNIPYRDEPEFESGQIVVDKRRCWKALELCHWYMQNSNNFFFFHVHGDKEIFHLAWRKLDQPYAMPDRGIDALAGVMCQHDFDGQRLFQHRNMRKWGFYHNPKTPGFLHEDQCIELVNELKHIWSPASQELATAEDLAAMSRLDGKVFEYHRVGYDHRSLKLRRDGTFAEGAAGCEHYWTVRNDELLVAGDEGQPTMTLTLSKHGIWEGQWLNHEKMPVLLVP